MNNSIKKVDPINRARVGDGGGGYFIDSEWSVRSLPRDRLKIGDRVAGSHIINDRFEQQAGCWEFMERNGDTNWYRII